MRSPIGSITHAGRSADLASTVAMARALGHPARMRIVAMLRHGELCVCQITEVLGLAGSTVSIHLKELRRCGLVVERKDGRWVWISLAEGAAPKAWLDAAIGDLDDDCQVIADRLRVAELRRLPVEDLCRLGYEAAKARAEARCSGRASRSHRPESPEGGDADRQAGRGPAAG